MYRPILMLLLFLSATSLFAQDLTARLKQLPNPMQRLDGEASQRALCRSVWDGRGSWLALWIAFGSGKGGDLGLTPAQIEQLGSGPLSAKFDRQKTLIPEIVAAQKAVEQVRPKDDPNLEKATETQKKEYLAAATKLASLKNDWMQREVEQSLTPEQIRKARALELQMYGGMGYPNPGMYESLGLNSDQKEKMSTVRRERDAEFEKFLQGLAAVTNERDRLIRESLVAKLGGKETISDEEWAQARREAEKQASKSESLKKMQTDNTNQGLELATRLQFELTEVLTKDQVAEMESLLEHKPEFVEKLIAAITKQREEQKPSVWQPGPDSWHPGQGVPSGFMPEPEKEKVFPKREQ